MRGRKLCFGLLCIKGGEAFVNTPGCLGKRTNHKCWASSSGPDSGSSGPPVDNVLLEAARQEVLATDAEWYRSIILGQEAQQEAAREAVSTPIREVVTADGGRGAAGPRPEPSWAGKLRDLGYTAEEIDLIPADVAEILIDSCIQRPSGGVPREWTAGWQEQAAAGPGTEGEDEEEEVQAEYVTRRAPRRRAVYYEDEEDIDEEAWDDEAWDEEEEEEVMGQGRSVPGRGRRGKAPIVRRAGLEEDDYGFGPTFDEEEPGFFPLAVRSLAHAVQQVPIFRPLLREPRFKNLLSREADFRLAVAGPWLAELLRDEYRWRLSVYRDYLRLDDDDDRRSRRERVRGTSLDPWTWGDEEEGEEGSGDTDEGAQGVYEDDVFEDQDADDVVVVVNKRGDKMRAEKSFGRPVPAPPRRRASGEEGTRRRRRDVEAWEGEEEENENEKSSTWSWVNASGRSRREEEEEDW